MSRSGMRAVAGRDPIGSRLAGSRPECIAAVALSAITAFANALINGDRRSRTGGAGILLGRAVAGAARSRDAFSSRGPAFFARWDRSPPLRT